MFWLDFLAEGRSFCSMSVIRRHICKQYLGNHDGFAMFCYMIEYQWLWGRLVGREDKFCLNTSVDWPHRGNSENNNPVKAVGERAGMKGSKSVLWTNRKAVSLASSVPRRLHVSRFHHNIQLGLPPLIGQTSVLIPIILQWPEKQTTAEQLCHLHTIGSLRRHNI